jgi:hypothetical protein
MLRAEQDKEAHAQCCEVTRVDVTEEIFCDKAAGVLLETVKVRVNGQEEERKCCCEADSTMCKLGTARTADMVKKGEAPKGCGRWNQGEGFLAYHSFFDNKGVEAGGVTSPSCSPKRRCVLDLLEKEELMNILIQPISGSPR